MTMSAISAAAVVLLDACCLLNLYASRQMIAILQLLPMRFVVAEAASRESLFVYRGGEGPDSQASEPVDLEPALHMGLLTVVSIESDDEGYDYMAFAAELDDGEAMSCALAKHRGYAIATDDRKALRVIRREAPHVEILSTPSLLKRWADATDPGLEIVRQTLVDVRQRGRFLPPKNDPLRPWWETVIGTAS